MNNSLVTVSIPTFNSQKFIEKCIMAINNQTYKNVEINIVDGNSKDKTVDIAKSLGVKSILYCKGSLMESRFVGARNANGKYVLLLDSDQILSPSALSRCIEAAEKNNLDILFLEEDVYRKKTFIEKLFYMDRKLVHAIKDTDPATSVLLPRFFKKTVLLKAYRNTPRKVIEIASPQDHAILYLEAWKITKKIGMINNAVKHIEPDNFKSLWQKYFRWGYYSVSTEKTGYEEYFKKRTERMRVGMFKKGLRKESLASLLLLIIKGLPYKTGVFLSLLGNKNR